MDDKKEELNDQPPADKKPDKDRPPQYRLDELLAGIASGAVNVDPDWEQMRPVGREFPNEE